MLGITGLLQPFPVNVAELWRVMVVTAVSAVLLVAVLRLYKGVPRAAGWAFLAAYVAFLTIEVLLSTS